MAEKLQVKIVGYDENHNLLVKFANDESKKTIDEYPVVVFQPSRYPNMTAEEIIAEIAKTGVHSANNQNEIENHAANTGKVIDLQDMIGTVKEYNITDLLPNEVSVPDNLTDIVLR